MIIGAYPPTAKTPRRPLASLNHSGEWRNWQTRRIQVPVFARTWGFKSPLAHRGKSASQKGCGDLVGDVGLLAAEAVEAPRTRKGHALTRRVPRREAPGTFAEGPVATLSARGVAAVPAVRGHLARAGLLWVRGGTRTPPTPVPADTPWRNRGPRPVRVLRAAPAPDVHPRGAEAAARVQRPHHP